MKQKPHIVVVGSLNMDLVVTVPKIPQPGETVLGRDFVQNPGGKGANQAVAAARLGAYVSLIGCVGRDAFAEQLLAHLATEGVNVAQVKRTDLAATGVALISVSEKGQNSIAVASGANFELTVTDVVQAWAALEPIDFLAMPLETPIDTIATAVSLAKQSQTQVILNPAPAQPLPSEILTNVDVIVPNETETTQLTGIPVSTAVQMEEAAQQLLNLGCKNVVLTLGGRGALLMRGGQPTAVTVPPYSIDVIDTTAAGDAFVAGLVVALSERSSLETAVQFANATGALATTKTGAQSAMPYREEVERLQK